MKDFLNKKYCLFPVCALVLTVITAVSLVCGLKLSFNYEIGYFDFTSPSFVVLSTSTALGVILTAAALLTSKDYTLTKRPHDNIATVFGSTFASVICLFNIGTKLTDFAKAGVPLKELDTPVKLGLVTALLQIFIPVYYLLSLSGKTRASRLRATVGSLGAMAFVAYLYASYFDFTLPINSPTRILNIIAASCSAVFMLGESRLTFPKDANRPPYRLSLASSVLCSSVSLGVSIAFIIGSYFITGAQSINPLPPILFSALYTATSITAVGRLISLKGCGKFNPKPKKAEDSESTAQTKNENN